MLLSPNGLLLLGLRQLPFPPSYVLPSSPLLALVVLGVGVEADLPLQVVLQVAVVGEVVPAVVAERGAVHLPVPPLLALLLQVVRVVPHVDVPLKVRGHVGGVVALPTLVAVRGRVNAVLVVFQRRLGGVSGPARRAEVRAHLQMDLVYVSLDVPDLVVAVVAAGEHAPVAVWDQALGPVHGLEVLQRLALTVRDVAALPTDELPSLLGDVGVAQAEVVVELLLLPKDLPALGEVTAELVLPLR